MDRSAGKKLNRETREPNAITQMGIADIWRTFHSNVKEYTLFSASQKVFSKIDHIFSNKENLNRYKNKQTKKTPQTHRN